MNALNVRIHADADAKLGERQKAVLECLRERGPFPGGGWVWDNYSGTARILDSLVKRGLVTKSEKGIYHAS